MSELDRTAALPTDDPRAVLRDHGLCEELDDPQARNDFEEVCKLGNVAAVRAYAALGIDLDSHAEISGETPLIRAAEGDQPEVVRALAAAGVDLQGRDGGGDTAIMTAVNWSHPAVLRALLEVGADPDAPDTHANYPLVKALESGDEELIDPLLNAASLDAGAATGDSALQWCVRETDADRLRSLLAREGADPNQGDRHGDTLLHLAIAREDADLVEVLLDAGADPNRRNRWGWAPLDCALARDAEDLVDRLREAGASADRAAERACFAAIRAGDGEAVAALLDAGLDVDCRDADGDTPLMMAIDQDQREIAERLLARGADINARDADEDNALSCASSTALRRMLLEAGVEASYRDSKGKLRQPGVEAVLDEDDQELLAVLLDARTNFSDLSDLSACHSSLIWGDFEDRLELRAQTLRTLGAAGADLDACGDDGETLLMGYIRRGHEAPALALIDVGVDLDRADHNHTTALIKSCGEYSEHEIQGRITAALLARGADYCKIDWLGRSAWDTARSTDSEGCLAALERVFDRTLADALADCGRSPDTDPEQFDEAVFAALVRRSDRETFLHWIRRGEHAIVRGLLAAGFDPNPPELDGGRRPGTLPLTTAISAGDEDMLAILLDGGADPNLRETYDGTAIGYALGEDSPSMVRRLLAAGATPESMNTPAHEGNLELLGLLHEAGASVQPRPAGHLPLHAAARGGQLEAAQWLLNKGADVDARDSGRVTALHIAIDEDHIELALALLAAGADPNIQTSDEQRTTPLIRAVNKGHVELVAALLAAGADPTVRDADGQSAIDYASYREELRALFPAAGDGPRFERVERELPALLRAVHQHDHDGFVAALEQAGPDASNYRGDTALMLALSFGRGDMVDALLDAGADVFARNAKGDTAWTHAFCAGREQLRSLLEQRGLTTSMDALNQMAGQAMRRDAAIAAIEAGEVAGVAKQIDELDFDVDWLGGVRPLKLAIDRGDRALIGLLLAKGADASLDAGTGQTLREYAESAGFGDLFD